MASKKIDIKLTGDRSSVKINMEDMSEEQAMEVASAIQTLLKERFVAVFGVSPVTRALELARKYPNAKLQAVKDLKEEFGIGLKEAKDFMDAAFEKLGR